jgi:AraC-like DNA-binding protein
MGISKKDPFRATNELCFFNVAGSPLGRLLAGGINRQGKLNNWWNIERSKKSGANYYLVMMLPGSAGFYGNEFGFECPLEFGDFFIAFPQHKHRYAPGETEVWSEMCVGFEGKAFDLLFGEKLLAPQAPVWRLENPRIWLDRLQALLHAPRPATPLAVARETATFLTFLLEMLETAMPRAAARAESDWFERACVMLTSDLSRPLQLRKIAAELGMNYETFRRHFRQRAGMPPGQFYDAKRCREACERLAKSQTPCWELARYLGFCDEQHFARRFKAWTGVSPRSYRTQHKIKPDKPARVLHP